MYRQPSRWERQIISLETAAQQGKFSITLNLYSSEYRKLKTMGFELSDPVEPYSNSQIIVVTWKNFKAPKENMLRYCFFAVEEFPKVCFADECFIKSFRSNLNIPKEKQFNEIMTNLMK